MRDMILGLMDPMDKMSAVIAERDAEIAWLRLALSEIADMGEDDDGFNPRTMRRLAKQTQSKGES